jgi:glycerol-3-phosphate dehydrogenase subunit C
VMVAEINQIARSRLVADRGGLRVRDQIISRPSLMGAMARPVAPIANAVMAARPVRVLVEKAIGVHRGAAMPKFSAMTFRSWARSHRAPAGTTRTVAYFHGCAVQEFEPEVGAAVVRVLERNGIRVTFPKQGCCGLPLVSNGDFDAGRSYATRLVRRLRASADDPGVIVASSTSCGMTLKAKYRELLGLDDADTRSVSRAVYDICEYLVELDDDGSLNRSLAPIRARALYHPPCQLMAHGVGLPALDLLALVPGLEVERSRAGCCGTAGTYGTKVEKYQIAMDVGQTLFDQVAESRPDFIVCDSETCRWHIAKNTGLPVYHPVQVLDRAYATA